MKKVLSTIIVLVLIGAAAYWIWGMKAMPSPSGNTSTSGNPSATSETSASQGKALTLKGPLGIATDSTGQLLTDKGGFTLYVNLQDENSTGKISPSCNATCENLWLPYLLASDEAAPDKASDPLLAKLNLFKRADGKFQYALGTKPLYRYSGDKKAGDKFGVTGNWVIARP